MSDDLAIKVENVSKHFVLPHEKVNSVKGIFTSVNKRHAKKTTEIQHALKDISFEIKKGEFFGIVGRNGSGKSTLLKILAGIYQPTSGTVQTHGKLVPFIELGVGFNPELTGRENVYLNGAMLGFSENEVTEMYDEIVEFAELERFMDQKLKNYSSGMQVRLAFSMATRSEADILLIDEVLAVGDADFQRKCFEYFKSLKRNKKTVIFVSHDMEAIREYCDSAIIIEENSIALKGSPDSIASKYSQLFMSKNNDNKSNADANRWGDNAISIKSIKVDVSSDAIKVSQTILANMNIDAPIVGIRIRNSSGLALSGTNSKVERVTLPDFVKGETLDITWEFPNFLSDGQYIVDPAIVHSDSITVADWWDDAARFNIMKQRHIPYPIDPTYTLKVSNVKS